MGRSAFPQLVAPYTLPGQLWVTPTVGSGALSVRMSIPAGSVLFRPWVGMLRCTGISSVFFLFSAAWLPVPLACEELAILVPCRAAAVAIDDLFLVSGFYFRSSLAPCRSTSTHVSSACECCCEHQLAKCPHSGIPRSTNTYSWVYGPVLTYVDTHVSLYHMSCNPSTCGCRSLSGTRRHTHTHVLMRDPMC